MSDYERGLADGKADVQNGVSPATAAWMFSHDEYWRGYRAGRMAARFADIGVTDYHVRSSDGFIDDYDIGWQDGAQDAERAVMEPAFYYGADEYAHGYKAGFNSVWLAAEHSGVRHQESAHSQPLITDSSPSLTHDSTSLRYRLLAALAFVLSALTLAGSVPV